MWILGSGWGGGRVAVSRFEQYSGGKKRQGINGRAWR